MILLRIFELKPAPIPHDYLCTYICFYIPYIRSCSSSFIKWLFLNSRYKKRIQNILGTSGLDVQHAFNGCSCVAKQFRFVPSFRNKCTSFSKPVGLFHNYLPHEWLIISRARRGSNRFQRTF